MKIKPKQDQCSVYERRGQLVFALNSEKMIPEDTPVRLVSAMLEELNYEALYRAYSPQGRKSAADPQVMLEVLVYRYLCGIYFSRKLEEACRYRVDFMWLMGDGRNSYSKTDENASFMRMKEDHMRNGQFKPFLWRLERFHRARYEDVVADAGYESLENDLYLDATG